METLISLILGLIVGLIITLIYKSIYIPKPLWIMAINRFDVLHTFIFNVEGKRMDPNSLPPDNLERWKLIDGNGSKKTFFGNIHFFPWPIFKVHKFMISYTKNIKPGEEKQGDIVLRKKSDPATGEILEMLILRTRESDHLIFREGYPMITTSLSSRELANINAITEPILEIENPGKVLFGIKDWLKGSMSILGSAIRGFVADKSLYELNKLSSEGGSETFNKEMKAIANVNDEDHPGLGNLGIKLFKHAFEDFDPADEKAIELMKSFTNVVIIEEEARANVKRSEGEATVKLNLAQAEANSFALIQEQKVKWAKKNLVDTGLAKINAQGEITELVPNADVKIGAEAIKALSQLTGTLVIDSGTLNKMFNINPSSNGNS